MDTKSALAALDALGQVTRLAVFRQLVQSGRSGLLAGEIGERLNVRQNTLSTHLAILTRAGLTINQREGRGVRYFADLNGMRGVVEFLLEDCCGGEAELCQPVYDSLSCQGDDACV